MVDPPYSLLAELTHACPLQCAYCSNPVDLRARFEELSTNEWKSIIAQAARMGVLQIHFSGGEPLIRKDLEELVYTATQVGLYSNLITSGISLTRQRMGTLAAAGIKAVQISVQDIDNNSMEEIIGLKALQGKLDACAYVRESDLPLTVNVVLHRHNIERLEAMVLQAVHAGASRVELANVQYYGWAFKNRSYLIPSKQQISEAQSAVSTLRIKNANVEIIYVHCDYLQEEPKPCMNGWGRRHLTIDPSGVALPCPAAAIIKTLDFPSARVLPLAEIWSSSEAFNAFRGNDWMQEPCRSCDRKNIDHGGCRCQAFIYTGDARSTDPVCKFSEIRPQIDEICSDTKRSLKPVLRTFER